MLAQQTTSHFAFVDWLIVICYLLVVVAIGFLVSRKHKGKDDYFLAGRSMPMWAVAISLLATSQSAATFVGGPQQAYMGNLTYLAANLGSLIAVILIAVFFIPAYYKHGVTSVYELLGNKFGSTSQKLASGMFMIGRVFASGARLYIVAIPFALIAFGDITTPSLLLSIFIITICAGAYVMAGGIRAVIWTDVLQAVIYIATILIALFVVWQKLPTGGLEAIQALGESSDATKLTILETELGGVEGFAKPYSIWAIVIGLTLFNLAAFGTDQDLAQRLLTCKGSRQGGWSVILANVIGWPVVFLFLLMGLLLFIFYQRPELAGMTPVNYTPTDSRSIFLEFILNEMPAGLRGLMMAGLFAAAMSSMDSALNAMSSTTIADFYRPWRKHKYPDSPVGDAKERLVSRISMAFWALCLLGFASFCVYWQKASDQTLIDFALGVMVFAYSGLLAVFLTAIFTNRGNAVSVAAALIVGFGIVLLFKPFAWNWLQTTFDFELKLAFPWQMAIATTLSFIVCCLGSRPTKLSSFEN